MATTTTMTVSCDTCGNALKLPVMNGQIMLTPALKAELDQWLSILRSTGEKFDYDKISCLQAGAVRLKPLATAEPEVEKIDLSKLRELAS